MFCEKCGAKIDDAVICPYCGCKNEQEEKRTNNYEEPIYQQPVYQPPVSGGKSRITAGLLQLFLGFLGVGRFYLGYTGYGIFQIVVSLLTCGIGGIIWGFADGILILFKTINYDQKGNLLDN